MTRSDKTLLTMLGIWFGMLAVFSLILYCVQPHLKHKTSGEDSASLKVWYDIDNQNYFLGMLPANAVVMYGNPGDDVMASTRKLGGVFFVVLDKKYTLAPNVAHEVLLHEQCHIITWTEFESHGPRWRGCMDRLYQQGAFRDLL